MLSSVCFGGWGKKGLWKDGRAEVVVYQSERVVYGETRKFQEHLITVAERLDKKTLVKPEKPKKKKTLPVFKLNQIQKFDTQNYPYSYMTSVFVDAKNPQDVIKLTMGSQEWCGNTFKSLKKTPQGETFYRWNSYFEGEAEGEEEIATTENDFFEDALPLSLRALDFKDGNVYHVRIWNQLTSNRAQNFEAVQATMTITKPEMVRSRAGSRMSWKVSIERPAGMDYYWFDKKYPHMLTKMETHDGRKRLIHGKARWKYWDRRLPMPNVLK